MKIAIVNSCYDRSTGKIAFGLAKYLLKNNYEVKLCYGRGKKIKFNYTYKIDKNLEFLFHVFMSRIHGRQGAFSYFATKRLIKFLKKNKIDTIYGIGLHGYYLNEKMFFNYIINYNIKFIYIMTEEYAFWGKCGYNNGCSNHLTGCGNCPQLSDYPKTWFFDRTSAVYKMKEDAYKRLKRAVFVGPEYTIKASKQSRLMSGIKTEIVDEGIDVKNLYFPKDSKALKKKLNISDDKIIILCVAPSTYARKGCEYFLEVAQKMVDKSEYVFVHVGFMDNIKKCPQNYIPIGYVTDQNILAEYYSMADLFFFPSLLDTMPNACLEALACGTPLLCFDISGMPYIANNEVATFVEAKNINMLIDVISKSKKKSTTIVEDCRSYALARYDSQMIFKKLLEIADNIL